ncbi:MAG TPA: hypothetical protein VH372_06565 [Actinospica sp.]|jgi:hypothetical protein|nr:hypothetical protein [Actinospica sp.]
MPGTHFTVLLSEDEIARIADAAVADLAARLAHRAFRPLADRTPLDQADALARLHALVHLRRAVERQADHTAANAAAAGAGYPQLGQACAISRQGARQRWPGLVGAHGHDHGQDDGPATGRNH